ncbi:hypothetical protein [Pseudonocardia spirodelae]|uniref:DUF3263 domain-containing protein n=1 Tax=Pseudonocardia spirodelae TaxID=3133431 RepID=A0ABU8T888_9PSEU
MLMTTVPMDHLVALARERQCLLRAEADRERLARAVRGPAPHGRLRALLAGWWRRRPLPDPAGHPGRAVLRPRA